MNFLAPLNLFPMLRLHACVFEHCGSCIFMLLFLKSFLSDWRIVFKVCECVVTEDCSNLD